MLAEWKAAVLRGGRPLTNGIKLVLLVLHDHMDDQGRVRVRYSVLTEALGVSQSNVSKRLADACDAQYLVKTAEAGYGYPPAYKAQIPGRLRSPTTTDHRAADPADSLTTQITGDHKRLTTQITGDHREAALTTQITGDLPKVTAESNHRGATAAAATTEVRIEKSTRVPGPEDSATVTRTPPRSRHITITTNSAEVERQRQLRGLERLAAEEAAAS